uniref:Uncharacterized protein n=1 Tax=Rhizophora mucronata TaxID=61149 RepID=A0A2P2JYQ6_RHIMU
MRLEKEFGCQNRKTNKNASFPGKMREN